MQVLGIYVLIFGAIGLVFGVFRTRSIRKVSADHGSVAVGRDNHASIKITTNLNAQNDSQSFFWMIWNIVTGMATFLGLALTLWPNK